MEHGAVLGAVSEGWETIKPTPLLLLWLLSAPALAGGIDGPGRVLAFSGEDGHYAFRFAQTGGPFTLIEGCPEFEVTIEYQRVPRFSLDTLHPSRAQTIEAAAFLQRAHQEDREVRFGYVRTGLVPSSWWRPCSFSSRGLLLEVFMGDPVVLSFYYPI